MLNQLKDRLVEQVCLDDLILDYSIEDVKKSWQDENGVLYSYDKKRVLELPRKVEEIAIKQGTTIICNSKRHPNTGLPSLKSVTIPCGLKYIGNCVFAESRIRSIDIPNSVRGIGLYAFRNCNELTSITIPKGTKKIADNAFRGCSRLHSVIIPESIVEIIHGTTGTFNYCNQLTSILIDEKNPEYDSRDNCNAIIETRSSTLIAGAHISTIPNGVVKIGYAAFWGVRFKSIVIPDSVREIDDFAFWGCDLEEIVIPDSVNTIGNSAFESCNDMVSITLSNSITKVGQSVFKNCRNLKSIFIPIGTMSLFTQLMPDYNDKLVEKEEDENLSTEVTEEDLAIAWTDEYGVKYSADKKRLLKVPHEIMDNSKRLPTTLYEYSIKEGTEIICDSAFERCASLSNIIIPNGVTHIGRYAFWCCQGIESIVLPDSVTVIEQGAFYECIRIKTIDLSKIIKTIGHNAFEACTSLESIILPDSVIELGNYVFQNCSKLHSATLPVSLKKVGNASFSACYNLDEIVIPRGVMSIGANAFLQCGRLKKIWFSENLSYVDHSAFIGCSKLEYIFIPDNTYDGFEKLLPEFKEILMESVVIENHEGLRRVFSVKEKNSVNKAEVVRSTFTNSVCFYMNDGCQKYIPLRKNSQLSIGDEINLEKAKLIEFTDEGIYYGFDGYGDYYSKYLVEA